jgi:hypothetical protein
MSKRATEETEPLTVRLPVALMARLRQTCEKERRALVYLVREALETYWFQTLTPGMRAELEKDQKKRGMSQQDYILSLFDEHYRRLLGVGPGGDERRR